MCEFERQTFAVLDFAAIDGFIDKNKNIHVELNREEIIEIACVKIQNGEITGHFHSFVGIDGYDANSVEFDDCRVMAYCARAEHLIGAPPFGEVIQRLRNYIADSVLVLRPSLFLRKCWDDLCEKAGDAGVIFDNRIIDIGSVYAAANLKKVLVESKDEFEDISIVKLARALSRGTRSWAEIFADYDIFFNPYSDDYFDKGRDDPLSWALAFVELFIALNSSNETDKEDVEITKHLF